MNPIKVGLIGFGRMGGFYLEEMQKSGNWDIVYICDVSPASRELAQRLSPRSKVISDEQIIFNDPEIQAVGLFAAFYLGLRPGGTVVLTGVICLVALLILGGRGVRRVKNAVDA